VRCAWCARVVPFDKFCRSCGCDLFPPDRYGAARMLKSAGVDRFALGSRLAQLDADRVELLSSQYARQAAVIAMRVEEAMRVEASLLQTGFAAELEEMWIASLPLDEGALAALDVEAEGTLEAIHRSSPIARVRSMAGVALTRRGSTDHAREAVALAAAADPRLALESALSLSHWKHHGSLGPRDRRALAQIAEQALDDPRLGLHAAILVAQSRPHDLRDALASTDRDLRFSAALIAGDEDVLCAALEDDGMRPFAERRLAQMGSPAAASILLQGNESSRANVIGRLEHPLSLPLLEALLSSIAPDVQHRPRSLGALVRGARFAEYSAEGRAVIARWIARESSALDPKSVLDLLEWATAPLDRSPYARPRDDEEIRSFVDAATEAIARSVEDEGDAIAFSRWLFAARGEKDEAQLDRLAEDPRSRARLLGSIAALHARLNSWGEPPDARAIEMLLGDAGIWARAGAALRLEIARDLGQLLKSQAQHRPDYFEYAWRRFADREDERDAILIALLSFRQEIRERMETDGPIAWVGPDPIRTFVLRCETDPHSAYEILGETAPHVAAERLQELVGAVFEVVAREDDPLKALPPVFRCLEIITAREQGKAVEMFRARWIPLLARIRSASPRGETESHYVKEKVREIEEILSR
jgi:hypothetical protein